MGTGADPLRQAEQGLRLSLRVQPGASADALVGVAVLDDGQAVLKLRVSAPPEDGKANAAAIRLLAKAWKLPKSSFRIVSGETARRKELLIEGDARRLRREIGAHLAKL